MIEQIWGMCSDPQTQQPLKIPVGDSNNIPGEQEVCPSDGSQRENHYRSLTANLVSEYIVRRYSSRQGGPCRVLLFRSSVGALAYKSITISPNQPTNQPTHQKISAIVTPPNSDTTQE